MKQRSTVCVTTIPLFSLLVFNIFCLVTTNLQSISNCLNNCSGATSSLDVAIFIDEQSQFLDFFQFNFGGNSISFLPNNKIEEFIHWDFRSTLVVHTTLKNLSDHLNTISNIKKKIYLQRIIILIDEPDGIENEFALESGTFPKYIDQIKMITVVSATDECQIDSYSFHLENILRTDTVGSKDFCGTLQNPHVQMAITMDLSGTEIRASAADTVDSHLEHLMEDDKDGNLKFLGGISVQLLNDMSAMLNFRIKPYRGEWIKPGKNNTLIGNSSLMLINGGLDIHISHTSLLPYRRRHLDYLQPTIGGGICTLCVISLAVFYTQPPAYFFRDLYIAPFQGTLWCAVILAVPILMFLSKVGNVAVMGQHPMDKVKFVDDTILWSIGVFAQQGWFMRPQVTSLRLILIIGSLFGLVCYVAYVAAIVSILSTSVMQINTFSELIYTDLPFFADKNSTTITSLVHELESHDEVNKKAVKLVPREESVVKLLNTKIPCAIFSITLVFYNTIRFYNISESWICKYMTVTPVNKGPTETAMVIPQKSKYKEVFNHKVIWLKQIGINDRYVKEYESGITVSCLEKQNPKEPLGMNDLATSFIFLVLGLLISLFVIVIEKIFIKTLGSKSGSILEKWRLPTKQTNGGTKVVNAKYKGGGKGDISTTSRYFNLENRNTVLNYFEPQLENKNGHP